MATEWVAHGQAVVPGTVATMTLVSQVEHCPTRAAEATELVERAVQLCPSGAIRSGG
jgi:uncharacterized Fe-S cluster protein YjdI